MRRYILLIYILIAASSNLLATNHSDTLRLDDSSQWLDMKSVDQSIIEEYQNDSSFNYSAEPKEDSNFFERLQSLFFKWLNKIIRAIGLTWELRWLAIIVLLATVTYFAVKNSKVTWFKPHTNAVTLADDENIHPETIDWEAEIQKAIAARQFRLAVRFQFLLILKTLSQESHIEWRDEKTNYDYIRELTDSNMKSGFDKLCRLYEAVWYGNFPITEGDYKEMATDFSAFGTSINQTITQTT